MKAFVTGATGFLGSRVVGSMRVRGDDVVALVRSPDKAKPLADIGCELVTGDLGDSDKMLNAMRGCDAVFHIAAIFEVGIPAGRRPEMYEANVAGTEHVLDAAIEAGVGRIVHVSTANVFGNTHGQIVDESYERPGPDFLSYYDETKYLSHQIALDRIRQGAPVVIVQPASLYGPNDHSDVGVFLKQAMKGKLRYIPIAKTGLTFAHVDDAAQGVLLAHDKGTIGESYILGGERATVKDAIHKAAKVAGRKPPRFVLPDVASRLAAPAGPLLGKLMGLPPNFREANRATHGVTYWVTDDKARSELGYAPRDLASGLRSMVL